MKKNDPNQLMLDFEQACTNFQQAGQQLVEAAQAVRQSQAPKKQKKKVKKALSDERRLFNKLVRCYAYRRLGGDCAAAYTEVYFRLQDRLDIWCQDRPPKKSVVGYLDEQGCCHRHWPKSAGLWHAADSQTLHVKRRGDKHPHTARHIPPALIDGFEMVQEHEGAEEWQADVLLRRWALRLAQLLGDELDLPACYIEVQSDGRPQTVRLNTKHLKRTDLCAYSV